MQNRVLSYLIHMFSRMAYFPTTPWMYHQSLFAPVGRAPGVRVTTSSCLRISFASATRASRRRRRRAVALSPTSRLTSVRARTVSSGDKSTTPCWHAIASAGDPHTRRAPSARARKTSRLATNSASDRSALRRRSSRARSAAAASRAIVELRVLDQRFGRHATTARTRCAPKLEHTRPHATASVRSQGAPGPRAPKELSSSALGSGRRPGV
mmetsp:Transcript_17721/g.55318  ORF Transcript_17721/g.55318 Transcript_17721/m.55318 type:complete len:211 (-) Transcript_17721:106-738(-)